MKDLSLHILDIVQNSLRAGADYIEITIIQRTTDDLMFIEIQDNGRGMAAEEEKRVMNPFYTTRSTRKIGLGLSLFQASARRCDGDVRINSTLGVGTKIVATYQLSHWDRPPLGDISETMVTLIAANPKVEFAYSHQKDEKEYHFDTKSLRLILEEVPISTPSVLEYIRNHIKDGVEGLN